MATEARRVGGQPEASGSRERPSPTSRQTPVQELSTATEPAAQGQQPNPPERVAEVPGDGEMTHSKIFCGMIHAALRMATAAAEFEGAMVAEIESDPLHKHRELYAVAKEMAINLKEQKVVLKGVHRRRNAPLPYLVAREQERALYDMDLLSLETSQRLPVLLKQPYQGVADAAYRDPDIRCGEEVKWVRLVEMPSAFARRFRWTARSPSRPAEAEAGAARDGGVEPSS